MLAQTKRERHRNYMRRRYQEDAEHRRKHRARTAVSRALLSGKLERGLCRNCGSLFTEAHHNDYDRPLEVIWLCRGCHEEKHGGRGCHG